MMSSPETAEIVARARELLERRAMALMQMENGRRGRETGAAELATVDAAMPEVLSDVANHLQAVEMTRAELVAMKAKEIVDAVAASGMVIGKESAILRRAEEVDAALAAEKRCRADAESRVLQLKRCRTDAESRVLQLEDDNAKLESRIARRDGQIIAFEAAMVEAVHSSQFGFNAEHIRQAMAPVLKALRKLQDEETMVPTLGAALCCRCATAAGVIVESKDEELLPCASKCGDVTSFRRIQ